MEEARWYVVHTFSGYENKVKADLEKTIENRGLQDQILEVTIPLVEVTESREGEQKTSMKKLFPAYVLVHMILNDDTWYVVRNTRGVTGFVGPGSKPVPLTEDEIEALGGFMGMSVPKARFAEGDYITVVQGAWAGTTGAVRAVNEQKKTVTIYADLFGRETPVEIGFAEVKKV